MLSIIIVNYKTPQLLIACLETVYRFTADIQFEVLVVDNASGDNSKESVMSLFPLTRWIQIEYNAGFARANNEGIRQSAGDAVLLLNSDTLLVDNAIGNCYRSFINSNYVACGVQLLNSDGSPQITGNYFMRGGLNNLLPIPYLGQVFRSVALLFKVRKPHIPDARQVAEVDWINGAFLMVKKDVINKAGMLDEDFFLYAEEAEWCARIGKFGKLAIFGQYKVIHLQGETSKTAFSSEASGYGNVYDKKGLQIMLSNMVRTRKQYGSSWFLLHLALYTAAVPFALLFKKHGAGYAKNILTLWKFAGRIISGRPYFYKVL
jgi:GT2 family glycosyltransferase